MITLYCPSNILEKKNSYKSVLPQTAEMIERATQALPLGRTSASSYKTTIFYF